MTGHEWGIMVFGGLIGMLLGSAITTAWIALVLIFRKPKQ